MPVVLKSKAQGLDPSNKTTKTKCSYAWAYCYQVPGAARVYVRTPVIDKISITVPVADPDLRTKVLAHLKNAEAGKKGKGIKKAYKWPARKNYWTAINCTLPNEQTLLVQANPKNSDSHLIRLEFNPARQWQWGLGYLKHLFDQITGELLGWGYVIEFGRATRIDVAVDLVGAQMNQLVAASNVNGKNHLYLSEHGDLETAYLGMPKVNKPTEQFVYDKLQDALDKGYEPLYDSIIHTRVEMIVKSSGQMLCNIGAVQNPLGRVTMVHPMKHLPCINSTAWAMFLEVCRFKGVGPALNMLPEGYQNILLAALTAGAEVCWRPDKLWKHWPTTVKASGLLEID